MLPDLLTLGSRLTFVGGKGGVGKTTTAAALALSLAERGREVLVLSVDPAHSLGDALQLALGPEPIPVPGVPGLHALEIDAGGEQERFLTTNRGALLRLLERGTYLDSDDIESLVDVALPGADEVAALLRLIDLTDHTKAYLVIDTAPTGHTLRLLDLPALAQSWLGALEAMEAKHRDVALALAGAYRPDETGELLRRLDEDIHRLSGLLTDPDRTRFVLVTQADPVVIAETQRYEEALSARGIGLAGIVVNRSTPSIPEAAKGRGMVFVPHLPAAPRGLDGLRAFATEASRTPSPREAAATLPRSVGIEVGLPFSPPDDRTVYWVAGKGGVGKSTVACALALQLAERRMGEVLLLGIDPAGSLGDVLGIEVGAEPRPVPEAQGLSVQQLDAEAGWAAFREDYRAEAEQLFSGLVGGGAQATADREVVERLIDLAPPGIDELMALLRVSDVTNASPYRAVVVDTAPTGHFLRLMELPGIALEWTHSVMRVLLKYREAIGLGGLAEPVLQLSRSLRDLRDRLRNPDESWFLAVALPEGLSVPETHRLLARLQELGIQPGGLVINRLFDPSGQIAPSGAEDAGALLALQGGLEFAGAPACPAPPVGIPALRAFSESWREIRMT